MTKTLNQIIFFPPPKSEYFFQQHWESKYLKKKKHTNSRVVRKTYFIFRNETKNHTPPPKLNGRSLTIVIVQRCLVFKKGLSRSLDLD
jgi:hypothetical protein